MCEEFQGGRAVLAQDCEGAISSSSSTWCPAFSKKPGRHQKGTGCRARQKRPRQNTGQVACRGHACWLRKKKMAPLQNETTHFNIYFGHVKLYFKSGSKYIEVKLKRHVIMLFSVLDEFRFRTTELYCRSGLRWWLTSWSRDFFLGVSCLCSKFVGTGVTVWVYP